ncbi:hypothetical protein [Clostridium sp. AM58-1XD]|uniref:hypothetical protein n=1 Tax=Clostridium sp. AM58-1XD TaxID=2292307 RepID=UPI001FA8C0AF|nr:hypothetical protein [Clostridium sp. AM58-1XD]
MIKLKKPLLLVLEIYGLCFIFRWIEYFIIRTDKTSWGEAILHKIAGIAALCIAVKLLSSSLEYLGFTRKGALKRLFSGLLFGISVFTIAYGVEILLAVSQGRFLSLRLYVSSYAVDGRRDVLRTVSKNPAAALFLYRSSGHSIYTLWSMACDRPRSELC